MAPKRKVAEPSTSKAKSKESKTKASKKQEVLVLSDSDSDSPPPKKRQKKEPVKPKASTSKSTAESSKKKKKVTTSSDVENERPQTMKASPKSKKGKAKDVDPLMAPYDRKNLEKLFTQYKDADLDNVITTEGLERLFEDAKLAMDGVLPFLLGYNMRAERMGVFTKKDIMNLEGYQVDNLPKLARALRIMQQDLDDNPDTFSAFYSYLFKFCLEEGQKSLPIDLAAAVWSVVWQGRNAVAEDFVNFVGTQNYKGVIKDLWDSLRDFSEDVSFDKKRNLIGYDATDSSWPLALDEYATYVLNGRVVKPNED